MPDDGSSAPAPTGQQRRLFSGDRRLIGVMVAASLGVFAVQLDFLAVQTAIPQMAEDLGTTATALQWVISGYMLAMASFLIVGGRIADIFGRRTWLIVGAAVFGAASLVAGAATSSEMVIGARLVQGVGAALLFPISVSVVTNAFGEGLVQRAVGFVFAIGSIAVALGPFIGGVIVEALSWRYVLWINIPISILVVVLALRAVENTRDETVPKTIDWLGLVFVVTSIVAFTYGIDRASDWGWTAPATLALISLGVVALAVFLVVELRVRHPLLDLKLFRIKVFSVMTASGSLGNAGAVIVIFMAMLWLQDIRDLSAFEAGVAFLSFSAGGAVGSVVSGRLESIAPWIVMTTALAVGGLGTIGMGLSTSLGPWMVFAFLAGVGLILVWSFASVVTQSVVPVEEAGGASGTVLTLLVSVGGVGLALAVSILDTHTTSGASNESEVIDAILVATGLIVLAVAPLVALFGRNRGKART